MNPFEKFSNGFFLLLTLFKKKELFVISLAKYQQSIIYENFRDQPIYKTLFL